MSFEEKTELIMAFDALIRRKVPGNAEVIAERLHISRRTFFRLIESMRENLDAPVYYNELTKRYEYRKQGKIEFIFQFVPLKELDKTEIKKINGGSVSFATSFAQNYWLYTITI